MFQECALARNAVLSKSHRFYGIASARNVVRNVVLSKKPQVVK